MPDDGVRCDILDYRYTPPPQPPDCPLDWGYSLTVTADAPGGFGCSGDTEGTTGEVLPFGSAITTGSAVCLSNELGVRCVTPAGHGFFVSQQRYETF